MQTKSTAKENIPPGITCTAPWRLAKVQPFSNYMLKVEFLDGTNGYVKMLELIMGNQAGIFAALKDLDLFNQVHIQYGTITWPGEIDLAPDAIHDAIKIYGECVLK